MAVNTDQPKMVSRNENKASKRQHNVDEPEWEYNSTDVFHKSRYMIEPTYGKRIV